MEQISSTLQNPEYRIRKFVNDRAIGSPQWWTPVWRGLTADPVGKHRKTMGAGLWLYLYLLTYANRKTGLVRRRASQIEDDTGYPLRTIQRHLKQLGQRDYITVRRSKGYLHIVIKKWKSFHANKHLL